MKVGVMIRSFPPHPNPLPPGERGGHSCLQQSLGVFWHIFIKQMTLDQNKKIGELPIKRSGHRPGIKRRDHAWALTFFFIRSSQSSPRLLPRQGHAGPLGLIPGRNDGSQHRLGRWPLWLEYIETVFSVVPSIFFWIPGRR